jgi:hypothetical protein
MNSISPLPSARFGAYYVPMIPTHQQNSQNILSHLAEWGFSRNVQQRMGALGIVWGTFETSLETTIWALRDEKVAGVRPWTDTTTIGPWIVALAKGSPKFGQDAQEVLRSAADAATDLLEYRHALIHGWMVPSELRPSFVRNPTWNGEKRKRQSSDAHVDRNLLDMAIDAAWVLCRVVTTARAACADGTQIEALVSLRDEVHRAASHASELRHLTALINDEKY